ncbi:ClpP family protease [Candidatus Entotheonella palauensis]|uniref:ClpP family protease n=1 Tax=Candidatus Entotheonella palauensis TaxID=93172 RepID=UPI000B7DF25C|nr:ATP-dependent Clp protease proteolytic subunit [Candidatus Entotheonella palauensis]
MTGDEFFMAEDLTAFKAGAHPDAPRLDDDDDDDDEEEGEEQEKAQQGPDFLGRSLMDARTVLISDPIDHKLTTRVIAQLLHLDATDPEKPIKIFINSPGGSADDGFAIYDIIRFIRPRVRIVSTGLSASAATVIMMAADKEDRLALPNARIMIHQPSMRSFGAAEDLRRTAEQILKLRARINELYAEETGQDLEKVTVDTDRDFWMTAQEAVEYGLISQVVSSYDDVEM